jgi:2-polyprenyl-3-methyl-5-hydroxy-6-metoxy-1,4-benzoquinol methylase
MQTVNIDKLGIRSGDAVLDVGCGSGRHLAAVFNIEGVTAIGVDLSLAVLDEARGRLQYHRDFGHGRHSRWLLTVSDMTCLPFPSNRFRHIICSEVLEHLADDSAALKELLRLLQPDGNLVISVPRYYPERICWAISKQYRQEKGGHVRIYRRRHLIRRCQQLGLHLWHQHGSHSLHVPYWWLKCLGGMNVKDGGLIKLYHRMLVWDMMNQPALTRWLEKWLDPIGGKSIVLYFKKPGSVKASPTHL